MDKTEILNLFGEALIEAVRDTVYRQFEKISKGELKSETSLVLYEELKHFNKNEKKIANKIVLDTIDSTLHYFLWMVERSEDFDLMFIKSKEAISLREISDGLCGALYTEEGWIQKFSKYPPYIE